MRFYLLISSLCLGITSHLYAQESTNKQKNNKDEELGVVVVESKSLQEQTNNEAKNQLLLGSIDIAQQQPVAIAESLENIASVGLQNSDKPLMGNISIRGFTDERINISVDNIQIKQYADGLSGISELSALTFSPSLVEQIVVDKGGEGVDFGSGAIGGAVQVKTKSAQDYLKDGKTFGAAIDMSTDSAYRGGRLGVTAYSIWNDFDVLANLSKARYGNVNTGKEEDTKNQTDALDGRIKLQYDTGNGITFGSVTTYSNTEASEIPFRGQDRWVGQPLEETEQMKRFQQGFSVSMKKGNLLNAESNFAIATNKKMRKQRGVILFRGNSYPFNNDNSFTDKEISFDIANTFKHKIGQNNASLKAKLFYDHTNFNQESYDYQTSAGETYYGKSKGNNFAISLREKINFGSLVTTDVGVRYDKYTRSSSKYSSFGKNKDNAFSLNAGVLIKPTEWLDVYTRYNEGFRAPNVRELYKKDEWRCHRPSKMCYSEPQPNLKSERSKNAEVGLRLNFDSLTAVDKLRINTSLYHNTITDYIATAPFMYKIVGGVKVPASPSTATHRDYSTKNIGKMKARGAEVEMSIAKGKFDADLAYSRIYMDVYDNPNFYLGTITKKSEPYTETPQDTLRVSLGYNVNDELRLGLVAKHRFSQKRLPEYYVMNDLGAEKSTTLDLNAQFKPHFLGDTTIKLTIKNLTDRGYHMFPDSSGKNQPGRSFRLGIESKF